jgi:hypothetical protein
MRERIVRLMLAVLTWHSLKHVPSVRQILTIRIPTRLVFQVVGHVQSAQTPVARMDRRRLKPANADHDSTLQTLNRAALLFLALDVPGDSNAQMALAVCKPRSLLRAHGVHLEIVTRRSRGHGPFPKDRLFFWRARQAFVF